MQRNCTEALNPSPPAPNDYDSSTPEPLPPMPCQKPNIQATQNAFIVGADLATLVRSASVLFSLSPACSPRRVTLFLKGLKAPAGPALLLIGLS